MRVWVTGTVQGVYFRESARQEAAKFNVSGWVRNLPDGRVEALFQGTPFAVESMVAWCRKGPERAVVRHVEAVEEPADADLGRFQVLR